MCPLCSEALPQPSREGAVYTCCYQRWVAEYNTNDPYRRDLVWEDFGLSYEDADDE